MTQNKIQLRKHAASLLDLASTNRQLAQEIFNDLEFKEQLALVSQVRGDKG